MIPLLSTMHISFPNAKVITKIFEACKRWKGCDILFLVGSSLMHENWRREVKTHYHHHHIIVMYSMDSSSSGSQFSQHPQLPPGFRFHPTDEELVVQYLKKKADSVPLPVSIIAEVDLYKFDPWELPSMQLHHKTTFSFPPFMQTHFIFFHD